MAVAQGIPDVAELFWNRNDRGKPINVFYKVVLSPDFWERVSTRVHAVMQSWLEGPQKAVEELCNLFIN